MKIVLIDHATKRGCGATLTKDEVTACNDVNNVQCDKCTSDNCNFLGTTNQLCVDCSSLENSECITNSKQSLSSVRCPAVLYDDAPMCYTKVVSNWNRFFLKILL